MLITEVRRLDSEKQARIREVTSNPSFNPLTHTMDSRVTSLAAQQNQLIGQIQEIDRQLQG